MNDLLSSVIQAHGGLERWNRFEKVEATIVSGGAFWGMHGLVQGPEPRHMTVWLHEERASVQPFGAPDQRTSFMPHRIAIEKTDGTIVAERHEPRAVFDRRTMTSPWDALDRAYFNGYALWTYLTTPFLLTTAGVEVTEIEPWREDGETWRVLRARFPELIETHSAIQDFFFGDDFLLRRHDYDVDISGRFPGAQLVFDYVEADGIRLPSKRRAYERSPDRHLQLDPVMVSIDETSIHYS